MRNATEAINLVAYSLGPAEHRPGDTIVLTELEHHSNLVPWQLLAQEKDADLEFVPIDDEGRLIQDELRGAAPDAAQAGRLQPRVERPGHHQPGARDGRAWPTRRARSCSSTAPRPCPTCPSTCRTLGADFYVFSGHKALGPTGSGALWARRELLEAMPPFMGGGEMIREVHLRRTDVQRRALEVRGRARRTSRAAIGLGAALDYLDGHRHGRTSGPTSAS